MTKSPLLISKFTPFRILEIVYPFVYFLVTFFNSIMFNGSSNKIFFGPLWGLFKWLTSFASIFSSFFLSFDNLLTFIFSTDNLLFFLNSNSFLFSSNLKRRPKLNDFLLAFIAFK